MLWRAKTNISRNKKGVLKSLRMTLIAATFSLLLLFLVGKKATSVEAQNYVTVTSSGNLTGGSNFFVDSSISNNFSLPLCNSPGNGGNTIAYIVPQASNTYQSQEQAAIDGINDVLVNAYKLNNPAGPTMNIQTFASEADLNSYVAQTNYRLNQICFAFSFSSFDPSLQQFEFNLLFYRTSIPETRVNQTSYQQAPFAATITPGPSKSPMPATIQFSLFNSSGFQQLMTTVTQQVILQSLQYIGQSSITPNFTVAYLPMNTGMFTIDSISTSLVMLVGLLAISIQLATTGIINNVVNEPHEGQLKQLLRQSGMSVQSEIFYKFTIYSILCAILVPLISVFLKLALMTNVSFVVIFTLMVMFVIEYFLLDTILMYGFGKYSPIALVAYIILTTVVTIITGLSQNISQIQVIVTSFIPSMQLQNFAKLAFLAMSDGSPSINFSQLSQGIAGIRPSEIFIIAIIDLVLFTVLLLYLWPLYFKVDPEKKLRFYYPFTCSYWQRNANQ